MSHTDRLKRQLSSLGGIVQCGKLHTPKLLLVVVFGVLAVEPAAAQPWAGGGGSGQLNEFASNFIPWAVRWVLVLGTLVAIIAHIYAGMTSNEDKAFRRKEWRNRAFFGVATAIPALIILNGIIVAFGGDPIDFFPFV
jgi:heme/copper-type cytochrome/quinol oxidase subunit 2